MVCFSLSCSLDWEGSVSPSPLFLQHTGWCMMHSRCLINVPWIKEAVEKLVLAVFTQNGGQQFSDCCLLLGVKFCWLLGLWVGCGCFWAAAEELCSSDSFACDLYLLFQEVCQLLHQHALFRCSITDMKMRKCRSGQPHAQCIFWVHPWYAHVHWQ